MAERIVSPGVFTREKDLSFLPQGIADIGAAIIGPTVRGPAFVPTQVTSFSEFENIFGGTCNCKSAFQQRPKLALYKLTILQSMFQQCLQSLTGCFRSAHKLDRTGLKSNYRKPHSQLERNNVLLCVL